jgi:hypothetical protein
VCRWSPSSVVEPACRGGKAILPGHRKLANDRPISPSPDSTSKAKDTERLVEFIDRASAVTGAGAE